MPTDKLLYFCPSCNALYQIVKVATGPETIYGEITCRACGGPLPAREGKFVLKYFMLRKATRGLKPRRAPPYDLIAAYQLTRARRCCSGTRTAESNRILPASMLPLSRGFHTRDLKEGKALLDEL